MKALVFRVGADPVVEEVPGEAYGDGLRQVIDGDVTRIILSRDPRTGRCIMLWCDDIGIRKGLPRNVWAEGPSYTGTDIHGTCVVTAGYYQPPDERCVDLTPIEARQWARLARASGAEP